jgi:hypothetical protein
LALTAQQVLDMTDSPTPFLNFYPIGFAGIQLSYPLFNGTVTQRKINQKKIELKISELQFGFTHRAK